MLSECHDVSYKQTEYIRRDCLVSNNSFGSIWFSMVLVGQGFINCVPFESFVVSFS